MGTSGRKACAQFGHITGATNQRTSIRRTAGNVRGAWGWLRLGVFCTQPQMLKEGEGDHAEDRVMMQPMPRTTFKVVEPEFFFHLLMHLLA